MPWASRRPVPSREERHWPGLRLLAGLLALIGTGAGVLVALILGDARSESTPALRATVSLSEQLGNAPAEGFARALAPRPFTFPREHGPHPGFRTEWWYWTGNVEAAGEAGPLRRFGFQLTFFRAALAARPRARISAWGTHEIYMAHFAVTDVGGRRFHAADRWGRAALGLAGAAADPFGVWVASWSATGAGREAFPMRLRAEDEGVAIDLVLARGKPPVLHGERGLSRKSAEPGNASYYYSVTRLPVLGEVRLDGRAFAVRGLAWMDREWSTSALAADQAGWDWFALQLDDRRELMLYRLRRRDGSVDPASQGTLVLADGTAQTLGRDAVGIDVLDHWTSPRDGTRYPARWRVRIPVAELDLTVTPLLADQELDLAVRYWEGAVGVEGRGGGRAVSGGGYVELVGYAGRRPGAEEAVRQ
jgi:predicted secreted hydrolase